MTISRGDVPDGVGLEQAGPRSRVAESERCGQTLVSVVVPTYNRERVLGRALDSVLRQTVSDLEVIVVDDGSTDGSLALLDEYRRSDPRVVVVEGQHRGANAARNTGLHMATGKYLAFIDSDDEWSPRFLERMIPYAKPGVLAFSSFRRVGLDGGEVVLPSGHIKNPSRVLLRGNVATLQTTLIRRSDTVGFAFDETLGRAQDWDFFLSALSAVEFVHVPEALAILHRQPDSISEGTREIMTRSLRRIWRKHWRTFARDRRGLARIIRRAWVAPVVRSIALFLSVPWPIGKRGSGARTGEHGRD